MFSQAFEAIEVRNNRTGVLLAKEVKVPTNMIGRAIGLLGSQKLSEGSGLLLNPCTMVHMFFMTYPIDVVFCNDKLEVIKINHNLKPWRCSSYVPRARFALELADGAAEKADIKIGDKLNFGALTT